MHVGVGKGMYKCGGIPMEARGIRSSRARVTDGCERLIWNWELNSGLAQRAVLLTTEPSPQHPRPFFSTLQGNSVEL